MSKPVDCTSTYIMNLERARVNGNIDAWHQVRMWPSVYLYYIKNCTMPIVDRVNMSKAIYLLTYCQQLFLQDRSNSVCSFCSNYSYAKYNYNNTDLKQ